MPLAQNCDIVKTLKRRRSALAQLVALYAEQGITSTQELVEKTGYGERQIRRAKTVACDRSPVTVPPGRRWPSGRGCPLPLPFPPGKAPPAPPLSKSLSKDSNTESTESTDSASQCALPCSREEDRRKVREAGRVLKLAPERARASYSLIVERHGRSIVDQALDRMATRLDAGAVFTAPATLLERIIGDIKTETTEREENIPYGAMVLDDGTVISRW